MKFINIKQAKGLTVGAEVYTLDSNGKYGIGRLVSRSEDAKGLHLRFAVPQYTETPLPVTDVIADNITHVCVIRDKVNGVSEDINTEAVNQ